MAEFDVENKKTAQILVNKARALQNRRNRTLILNAALLSVYGWQLSIPVILGIALGHFLDKTFPSSAFSWTFNLIFIGFIIGIVNANRWLHKEGTVQNIKKQYRQRLTEQRKRTQK